ncbi:MAG: hypothetical protein WA190_07815 [Usitatibacter sp.]
MTAKQQIATGFLAVLIVCSVAFMPASADSSSAAANSTAKHASPVVATKAGSSQVPDQPTRALTYN